MNTDLYKLYLRIFLYKFDMINAEGMYNDKAI